jgi:hypothetical protein
MFAGEKWSWGLYHLVAISAQLDKTDKPLTPWGGDDTLNQSFAKAKLLRG